MSMHIFTFIKNFKKNVKEERRQEEQA